MALHLLPKYLQLVTIFSKSLKFPSDTNFSVSFSFRSAFTVVLTDYSLLVAISLTLLLFFHLSPPLKFTYLKFFKHMVNFLK